MHVKALGLVLALVASLTSSVVGCAETPTSEAASTRAAATEDTTGENPDTPSAEEIAEAQARILRDFGGYTDPATVTRDGSGELPPKYAHLDPQNVVPRDLLVAAVNYLDANPRGFPNKTHLTVVDFKQHSARSRFYLVNLESGAVERYHTTHGLYSDVDDDGLAESFGNVVGSGKSSLGFVRVSEVYSGTYRRSIRLDGLSTTNSNIRERAIVFHGWDKVKEADVKQGLSWGCITLDWIVKDGVLDKIKEGSLMYLGVSKLSSK